MLQTVFKELDHAVSRINVESRNEGSPEIPRFFIKVIGQTALLEANIDLMLFATADVDAYANFKWLAKRAFEDVLKKHGKFYDELSNEIWMPTETRYRHIFAGDNFDGYIAEPVYVLLSKAKMAPEKNLNVIREYLAKGPDGSFFDLANKYLIDLTRFV